MAKVTKYYIKHKDELDKRLSSIPVSELQLIKAGEKCEGSSFLTYMNAMFECNYFREISQCDADILSTCEFDNHLNDYIDLNYDEKLCCKP